MLGVIIVVGAVVVGLIGMYQYRQVSEMLAAHGELSQTSKAPAVVASLVVLVVLVGLTVYLAAGFR